MPKHSERRFYYLVDEDFYLDSSLSNKGSVPLPLKAEEFLALAPSATGTSPLFKFGRMFDQAQIKDEAESQKELEALTELGLAMNEMPQSSDINSEGGTSESEIPSGYTYFGQFLAHEITFDGIPFPPPTVVDLNDVSQKRSPSIDCDSLYGGGPDINPELYQREKDGSLVRLKIGQTIPSPGFGALLSRDLPRQGEKSATPHVAILCDERNDENLPVAQMHVAFILFHNTVVGELSKPPHNYTGKELFEKAREQVVRHLQWIVLKDYLPRIVMDEVLNSVIALAQEKDGELEFFKTKTGAGVFMPVEFSVAAFRLGHSMVRNSYEWNFFHRTKTPSALPTLAAPATILDFFIFTGHSGNLAGFNILMSEWVVDWRRFFDFSEIGKNPHGLRYNRAKKIDPTFNFQLDTIPGFPHQQGDKTSPPQDVKRLYPLTVRNLRRGFAMGLPSGQAVADKIGLKEEERLTQKEIATPADSKIAKILTDNGFNKNTPLWFYILKEAEHFHEGNRLGPVGSRIVAETIVGLIWNSDHSILKDGWKPKLGDRNDQEKFDMIDMLKYTNNIFPVDDTGQ